METTNPETIENFGFGIRRSAKPNSVKISNKRSKALYGTHPEVLFYVWNQLVIKIIIEKYDLNRLKRFFYV